MHHVLYQDCFGSLPRIGDLLIALGFFDIEGLMETTGAMVETAGLTVQI